MAKMPQAWTAAVTAQTKLEASKHSQSIKVEARIDMSAEVAGAGLCPDCRKPMEPMVAAGVDTLTCMPCRISLPTADEPESVVIDNAQSVGQGCDEGASGVKEAAATTFNLY